MKGIENIVFVGDPGVGKKTLSEMLKGDYNTSICTAIKPGDPELLNAKLVYVVSNSTESNVRECMSMIENVKKYAKNAEIILPNIAVLANKQDLPETLGWKEIAAMESTEEPIAAFPITAVDELREVCEPYIRLLTAYLTGEVSACNKEIDKVWRVEGKLQAVVNFIDKYHERKQGTGKSGAPAKETAPAMTGLFRNMESVGKEMEERLRKREV